MGIRRSTGQSESLKLWICALMCCSGIWTRQTSWYWSTNCCANLTRPGIPSLLMSRLRKRLFCWEVKNFQTRKNWYRRSIRKSEWIPSQSPLSCVCLCFRPCSVMGRRNTALKMGRLRPQRSTPGSGRMPCRS